MLKFWARKTSSLERVANFNPDSPVIPDLPVQIEDISVSRREYFPNAGPIPWLDSFA
jgi:hypothetical protein